MKKLLHDMTNVASKSNQEMIDSLIISQSYMCSQKCKEYAQVQYNCMRRACLFEDSRLSIPSISDYIVSDTMMASAQRIFCSNDNQSGKAI